MRLEVERAFAELVQALNESPMAKRASALDKGASGYWGRIIERGARSFENYVISKMAQRGWSNDFLANVRDWQEWEKQGKNAESFAEPGSEFGSRCVLRCSRRSSELVQPFGFEVGRCGLHAAGQAHRHQARAGEDPPHRLCHF
jgi:hypothetical protein